MTTATMPARLYLLRHAQAAWALPGERDFDRSLDPTGLAGAGRVAAAMATAQFLPRRILCSPARRCRQTLAPILAMMPEQPDILYVDDLYTGDGETYRRLLQAHADIVSLLLVGHNPSIDALFRSLVGDVSNGPGHLGYPPGALAVVDGAAMQSTGKLVAWIDPDGTVR